MIPHPERYPVHADQAKGQTLEGECNRTACKGLGSVHFNWQTYGLYCPACARVMNEKPWPLGAPICLEVEREPTLEEMDIMHDRRLADCLTPLSRELVASIGWTS